MDEDYTVSEEHLKRITALDLIPKEVEEAFEDTWKGLTIDVYSTLREDLKSKYEQARL